MEKLAAGSYPHFREAAAHRHLNQSRGNHSLLGLAPGGLEWSSRSYRFPRRAGQGTRHASYCHRLAACTRIEAAAPACASRLEEQVGICHCTRAAGSNADPALSAARVINTHPHPWVPHSVPFRSAFRFRVELELPLDGRGSSRRSSSSSSNSSNSSSSSSAAPGTNNPAGQTHASFGQ